jgi:DNA polymerase I-like protein with 3'-5' exonuclease and polymerase domains
MFFDDEPLTPRKRAVLKAPPPIHDTGWRAPTEFPNLSAATIIGLDTETKELDFDYGPGWGRGRGHICGVSIAARDRLGNRGKWYFPVRHEVCPEQNLNPEAVFGYLREALSTNVPKVGANIIYDLGWLATEGVYPAGELHDVQFAQALLDEYSKVALEDLAYTYLGKHKSTTYLNKWCHAAYGGNENEQRANIYRAPPCLVGLYGEDDADLPIDILERQWRGMTYENLHTVYRVECDLIRLLVRMRLQGVRVDIPRAEQLRYELSEEIKILENQLWYQTGIRANVNSSDDLARIFDSIGLQYPRTAPTSKKPDGSPSFRKDFMKNLDHPVTNIINDIREHEKLISTFLDGYILSRHVNGRIFASFHPLRGEEGGTGVGRFSSSDPNLQNIPARTKLGKKVRTVFVPDHGHLCWQKSDYSQLQYRGLACYAVDKGDGSAEALRNDYRTDPKTDYHDRIQTKFKEITGKLIERRPIKNTNFGLMFGLGTKKLIRSTGIEGKAGEEFYKTYHQIVPYAKPTMRALAEEVQAFGYTISPLGRRCRFNLWEPLFDNYDHSKPALPYDDAIRYYGNAIKRANDYTAIAYKLQSFEADIVKKSLVDCYNAGIYEVTGLPKLLVHDENDFSVISDAPEQQQAYAEMQRIMETSIPLPVPLRVDATRGATWGACKD